MPRKKKNPVQKVPGGWRAIVRGRIGPLRTSRRDAEIDAEQRNPKKAKHTSRKQKPAGIQRKPNAGIGTLFDFHGTFNEKSAAMAKEAKVPGSFIKTIWFKSGPRYAVVTRHANPKRKRKNAKAKCLRKERQKTKGKIRQNAKHKVKHSRGNPDDATKLYTQFHGRGPKRVTTHLVPVDPYGEHPTLAQLGKLVSVVVGEGMKLSGSEGSTVERVSGAEKSWIRQIDFSERESPDVAAEPGGQQIYFVGGKQELTDDALRSLGADPRKDLIDLGFCYRIEYFTRKKFDQFQPVTYWHLLGEESSVSPRLMYDRARKTLFLAGGEYIVKPEGIVN